MLTKDDIVQIGEEMVRALEPAYKDLTSIKKTLNEHTDKIDALTADVKQLQDEIGVIKDDIKNIKEDLGEFKKHNQNEHNKIQKHIGMPIAA